MRAALAIGAALLASACDTPPKPLIAGIPELECGRGFDRLTTEINALPGVVVDRHDRGSVAYRDDRASAFYLVTLPDHPAHPAIFVRHVVPTTETMVIASGGCGFGDAEAFNRQMALYAAFDRLLNAEEPCYLCSQDRLRSPTVDSRQPPPPM